MPDKKKTCFVIMPISTHDSHLSSYREDNDHFSHVLEFLFKPAIEKLSFDLIPPSGRGADLIQAEIIRNLEESDLVLCDMSTLNPNVFFELGIRTALNKPVCMVKDNKTPSVPFDTSIINFHTYNGSLDLWILEDEIEKLRKHLDDSLKRSKNENMLWKYFGFTTVAQEYKQESGIESKVDFLMLLMEAINRNLRPQKTESDYGIAFSESQRLRVWSFIGEVEVLLHDYNYPVEKMRYVSSYEGIQLIFPGFILPDELRRKILELGMKHKFAVSISS